jgi:integrase
MASKPGSKLMTRGLFKLQVGDLSKLAAGFYSDGGNLYLDVERNVVGDGFNRRWIFRYQLPGGRQRDMGLGSVAELGANTAGLSVARELAQNARQLLARGLDPIDERKKQIAARLAALPVPTFEQLTKDYLAAKDGEWSPKVVAHWQMTFADYCKPIHKLPVNLIDTDHVLGCLRPIWKEKTATAQRVQNRIERVLSFATVKKYRSGDNPARWRGHLDHLLAKPSKIARTENHPALNYREMPAFMQALRSRKNNASTLALEFLILCCARTNEVLAATWDEIDLAERKWTVPGERMKMNREHVIPLTARAVEILQQARTISPDSKHVFVGYDGDRLSSNSLLALIKRRMGRGDISTHGFRATFKTWATEQTNFANDVSEAALAHLIGNKVEQAYRRGDLFKKRRALAEAWANYCATPGTNAKVLAFKR